MRPSVVVVGSGAIGSFAAYFLARLGIGATIVEQDAIGSHASGSNPGGLNPLHGPGIPGPMQALAWESLELHLDHQDALRQLSGIDCSARRVARLELATTEAEVARLEPHRALYESAPGFSARWLEPKALGALRPRVGPAAVRGLWTEGNVRVDARAYTRAAAGAAVMLGARVVAGRVRGVRRRGGRATGVVVDTGTIRCTAVVVATGPWAAEPSAWLGAAIEVEPMKGELLLAAVPGPPFACDVTRGGAGLYHRADGTVWLGGTEERAGFDAAPSAAGRRSILRQVAALVPDVARARVLGHRAALRPATPDGLPVVGLAPGWDNVCLAMGAGRKGMLLATGMGQAAAEIVTRGATRLSVSACAPARFRARAAG